MRVEIELDVPDGVHDLPFVRKVHATLERDMQLSVELRTSANETTSREQDFGFDVVKEQIIASNGRPLAYLRDWADLINPLLHITFVPALRSALNISGSLRANPIKIGSEFAIAWRDLKTGDSVEGQTRALDLEKFIGEIFGLSGLQINSSQLNELILSIEGRSYPLEALGNGIANSICGLVGVALSPPRILLLDEPDASLHPALQLSILSRLSSFASDAIYFATHSIGLAKSFADDITSLHRVDGRIACRDFESAASYSELLGELSFGMRNEIGVSCILLVEGPSDVRTVEQLLRILGAMDNVCIAPLGGSEMIVGSRERELSEFLKLNVPVFALVDRDPGGDSTEIPQSRTDFLAACERLSIHCHVTERRAIENYFSIVPQLVV